MGSEKIIFKAWPEIRYPQWTKCGISNIQSISNDSWANQNQQSININGSQSRGLGHGCGYLGSGFMIDIIIIVIRYITMKQREANVTNWVVDYDFDSPSSSVSFDLFVFLNDQGAENSGNEPTCTFPEWVKTEERDQIVPASTYPVFVDELAVYYFTKDNSEDIEIISMSLRSIRTLFDIFTFKFWFGLLGLFVLRKGLDRIKIKTNNNGQPLRLNRAWFGYTDLVLAASASLYSAGLLTRILQLNKDVWIQNSGDLARLISEGKAEMVLVEGAPFLQFLRRLDGITMEQSTPVICPTWMSTFQHLRSKPKFSVTIRSELSMTATLFEHQNMEGVALPELPNSYNTIYCNSKVPKGFIKALNQAIAQKTEDIQGIIDSYRKELNRRKARQRRKTYKRFLKPIDVENIMGLFVLLSAGFMISVLMYCFEQLRHFVGLAVFIKLQSFHK